MNRVTTTTPLVSLAVAFALLVGACASTPEPAPADAPAVKVSDPVKPAPVPAADAPEICVEPDDACCEAETAECVACRERLAASVAAWDACQARAHAVPPTPSVERARCESPPPVTACCMVMTPECTACQQRNSATLKAWRDTCFAPAAD